jgi:protein subunit release factor A
MTNSIEDGLEIRVTDQRIGMGISGYDTIIRVHHIPSGIVVEMPNRFASSQSVSRLIAVEMIEWAMMARETRHE